MWTVSSKLNWRHWIKMYAKKLYILCMLHHLKISGITTDGYIVDYRCSSLPEDQVIILGCNVVADLKH